MQPFPLLFADQVALLRAEFNTGHVLDENLALQLNNEQRVYSIFNSLDEAIAAANEITKDGKVECVIYGKDKAMPKYITPPPPPSPPASTSSPHKQ